MRIILTLPLLLVAACNVDNDSANDQMTLEYDQQKIENAAASAARTAKEVGSAAGNVAVTTGRAIKDEVGDIDVDVDVKRDRDGNASAEAGNRQ
jgi:hypothetical protein